MTWFEALILGIIQGLTEFLPVSSSGHLEIGKQTLGVEAPDNLTFTVVVHGATVLSTIFIFRKDLANLITGFFNFSWNEETQYLFKIAVSMIPIGIVGVFFKDYVEELFNTDKILLLVGIMLLITAALLAFTFYAKAKEKDISFKDAFIIGIAQTIAVLPGISRSGSTIATGLLLGNKREAVARFSFLMVLIPILGENVLSVLKDDVTATSSIGAIPLTIGFISAFISGLLACKAMINLVKKGKLIYFALYCAIVGAIAIIWGL
ncbi:undecaprenyl-diphosphate phosphatase [Plebeiibacterium sediminum]|uniref:Undecaprenyl-diphosphatase n=1 Tax=Plebeiibacterium sediminum TaxID=2992112 RepID=A0AAE3M930_9BACT|nr:undecaprenyl-diphosphate phosphatase [Plebeiobacterium sediminum]MCW3789080.1 undecaprenyl-diphosphate phosphatase [Plebeiobacterium sediminum]